MYAKRLIRALVLGGFFLFFGIKSFYTEYSEENKFNSAHKKIEGVVADIHTSMARLPGNGSIIAEYEEVLLTLQDSSKYKNTSNNLFSASLLSKKQPVTVWVHKDDTEPVKTIRQLESNNAVITKAKLNIIAIPWFKYVLTGAGIIGLIAGFMSLSKTQQKREDTVS